MWQRRWGYHNHSKRFTWVHDFKIQESPQTWEGNTCACLPTKKQVPKFDQTGPDEFWRTNTHPQKKSISWKIWVVTLKWKLTTIGPEKAQRIALRCFHSPFFPSRSVFFAATSVWPPIFVRSTKFDEAKNGVQVTCVQILHVHPYGGGCITCK